MVVCMDVTKCIVMKLQKLQTSLAQIYLLTTEIYLPSDVEKFCHLEFMKTNI
jgi:hypothetical protein